jgi:hypothetical protein
VTLGADIIKQKLPENNGGFKSLNMGSSSYGKLDERMYTELSSDHPIDLCRYQVANCYMGRIGLINSGGPSGNNDMAEAISAYAETKYYQAKYYDRMGSLNMDFNPKWVPGTGGTLYVRATGVMLSFYVTSVTHRIDTSAPNHGNASTTVNFCCGRIGSGPEGVSADRYLGYDAGKESGIQGSYVGDMGA